MATENGKPSQTQKSKIAIPSHHAAGITIQWMSACVTFDGSLFAFGSVYLVQSKRNVMGILRCLCIWGVIRSRSNVMDVIVYAFDMESTQKEMAWICLLMHLMCK